MKVISFSVWGDDPSFVEGALQNAELAKEYYPGWQVWMYCGYDVPVKQRERLRTKFKLYLRNAVNSPWEGLFWRFEPACCSWVEAFISRDCDSRLNPREAAAVEDWLKSGKTLHTMRDHYEHIVPILGGMWGLRYWPAFEEKLKEWTRRDAKGTDQDFLRDKVWPVLGTGCVCHDRYPKTTTVNTHNGPFSYRAVEFFGAHDIRAFPTHPALEPRHGEHVGSRVK